MLSVLLTAVDQRRRVPFIVPEVEFPVGFVPILSALEESLRLGFLAGLHPLCAHGRRNCWTDGW